MLAWLKSGTISTGLAVFSMFFGAGNIVFPLAIGQYAQSNSPYAILGILITAVLVPFLGLTTMTLFRGNYMEFFGRMGKVPGFLMALFLLALIGPLGAMPRCVTLSYSTFLLLFPDLSLLPYSLVACLLVFLLAYSQQKLLDILGYILTPVLVGSLFFIIVKGLIGAPVAIASVHDPMHVFFLGFLEGYKTMDLLGALFFSSVVLVCLEEELGVHDVENKRSMMRMTLKAGCIGTGLLALVYVGFSFLAAAYAPELTDTPKDFLLGQIALNVLGPYAGVIACTAVVLACLTTAIALAAVFSQFLHETIFNGKVHYHVCLAITMLITFLLSMLGFGGIDNLLGPLLAVIYPALIMLTAVNLAYKLWGFSWVKLPVYATLVASIAIALFAK